MSRSLFRAAAIGFAAIVCASAAFAEQVVIEANKSTSLKLKSPAASVVIGNPRVADVAVHDASLIFITGRSFGTTNLLIFSEDGTQLFAGDVVVTTNTSNLLNVNRAGLTNTYDCAPTCRSVLSIGDDVQYFDNLVAQSLRLEELSSASD